MHKVFYSRSGKTALALLEEKMILSDKLKNSLKVQYMRFNRGAKDKDVIKENYHKPSQKRMKDVIHQGLERGMSIY